MVKRITLPLGALLILVCALTALAADPTPAQVYQAAASGNLPEAQQMIAQVLRLVLRVHYDSAYKSR